MDFKDLVENFIIPGLIQPVINLTIAAAVVFFLWNVFLMVKNAGDEKELEKFKQRTVWGIVALAVMVSMWGLVNFLTKSAKLDTGPITIPTL